MSPNNKPIRSKRIEERKPINTNPIASVECARRPSKESPANFVLFCKLIRSIATTEEIMKTDSVIFILNAYARVTPSKAECDNVSPKYDKRLHITKQPSGPAIIAIPTPAIKARVKKSSNII